MDGFTDAKFLNNNSKRWDGKASEVPTKTVVRTGRITDGFEEAEVHWPAKETGKGKGGARSGNALFCQRAKTRPHLLKSSDSAMLVSGRAVCTCIACAIVLTAFST